MKLCYTQMHMVGSAGPMAQVPLHKYCMNLTDRILRRNLPSSALSYAPCPLCITNSRSGCPSPSRFRPFAVLRWATRSPPPAVLSCSNAPNSVSIPNAKTHVQVYNGSKSSRPRLILWLKFAPEPTTCECMESGGPTLWHLWSSQSFPAKLPWR